MWSIYLYPTFRLDRPNPSLDPNHSSLLQNKFGCLRITRETSILPGLKRGTKFNPLALRSKSILRVSKLVVLSGKTLLDTGLRFCPPILS